MSELGNHRQYLQYQKPFGHHRKTEISCSVSTALKYESCKKRIYGMNGEHLVQDELISIKTVALSYEY